MHGRSHTSQVIYRALIDIIQAVRAGENPVLVLHSRLDITDAVRVAWNKQGAIEWNQIIKGRLSTKWGYTHAIHYW